MNTIDDMMKVQAKRAGMLFDPVEVTYKKTRWNRKKNCFGNSFHYVANNPKAKYVLGQLFLWGAIPIEHAWVKDGDEHYELTIKEAKEGNAYFAMVELSIGELVEIVLKNDSRPPSLWDYQIIQRRDKH